MVEIPTEMEPKCLTFFQCQWTPISSPPRLRNTLDTKANRGTARGRTAGSLLSFYPEAFSALPTVHHFPFLRLSAL
jgi:hypothetical protein